MFTYLRTFFRHYRQIAVVGSLGFATAVCLGLLVLRVAYTHTLDHTHLVWNLFLAWLPMLCALMAYNSYKQTLRLSGLGIVGASAFIWLIFFPNAPYLITDLIHLQAQSGVPYWYDLLLMVAFAWTGSFLGLVSLYLMQLLVRQALGGLLSWLFAFGVLGLSGFGIYLGRFLRWNSWDILANPLSLFGDILERVRHPLAHSQTFVFSLVFSAFFVSAYLVLCALVQLPRETLPSHKPG